MPEIWDNTHLPSGGSRATTPEENNAAAFGVSDHQPEQPTFPPEEQITNEDGEVIGEVPLDGMGRPLVFPNLNLGAAVGPGQVPPTPEQVVQAIQNTRVKPVIVTWQVYPFDMWENILNPDLYQAQQLEFQQLLRKAGM